MSRLVVQKYGGSVLRDEDSVRRVARVVGATAAAGDPVVVVVSALASVTDRQLERAARFSAGSSTQEMMTHRRSVGWCSATRRGRNSSAPIRPSWAGRS